jgi:hypothetical protein
MAISCYHCETIITQGLSCPHGCHDNYENTCTCCGEQYPTSHLVYISMFDGYYCSMCHSMETDETPETVTEETLEYEYNCSDCGESYPRTHLVYLFTYDHFLCDRCYMKDEVDFAKENL